MKVGLIEGHGARGLVRGGVYLVRTTVAEDSHVETAIEGHRTHVGVGTDPCGGWLWRHPQSGCERIPNIK